MLLGNNTSSRFSLPRFSTQAVQLGKETAGIQRTARRPQQRVAEGMVGWELPPSLREEKGQAYGFPPRPFSCVMTPNCLQ